MDIVCGGNVADGESAHLDDNATSANSSCAGGQSSSCGGGSDVAGKYVITNSCALFDFVAYTVFMGSLSVLGLVGNVVSFVVLLRDRGRSATSFLLQALAVADTMVLVAAVPLYIIPPIYPYTGQLATYYAAYLSITPVLWPVYFIPYTFTVLVTVLVSMHRYCAVCKPFVSRCARIVATSSAEIGISGGGGGIGGIGGSGRIRHGGGGGSVSINFSPSTARQARCRVAGLAAFSIVYNIPRFFEYESVPMCIDADNETQYVFKISSFGDNRLYRILYSNVLYFIVIHGGPLLLIGFFNVKLIMALKRRQRRWAEMGKGWYQQDVSLVLVVVMCVFIVCQTPTFIDHILWTFVDDTERACGRWHYYYTAISDVLVIFNSSVNFVIYILTSRNFRQGLAMQALASWASNVRRNSRRFSMRDGGSKASTAAPTNRHAGANAGTAAAAAAARRSIACGATFTSGLEAVAALQALRTSPATAERHLALDAGVGGGQPGSTDAMRTRRATVCSIELVGVVAATTPASVTKRPSSPTSSVDGQAHQSHANHQRILENREQTTPSSGVAASSTKTKTVRYFEPRVVCR